MESTIIAATIGFESPSKSEPFDFGIRGGLLINPLSKRFDTLGFFVAN